MTTPAKRPTMRTIPAGRPNPMPAGTVEVICPCRCPVGTMHGGCLTCGSFHAEFGDTVVVRKGLPPKGSHR